MITRLCCVAALLVMPAAAMAQGNPGPYGGLFGRMPARNGQDRTIVEVRSNIGAQYDSALLPPEGAPETELQDGLGTAGSVALIYQHETDKFTAVVNGGAGRTQYLVSPAYGLNLYTGSAAIGSAITNRVRADASISYAHSPFYEMYPSFGPSGVFAVGPVTDAPFGTYATQMLENETVQAEAAVTARLSQRTKFTASAYRRQTYFTESPADFMLNGYQGRLTWEIRRDLGVHAGYGLEHSIQYGEGGQEFDNETIDIGVDYTRSFSIARRTTLGFSTSTSIVKTGTSAREVRLNGGVVLSKYFRRTWRASAHAMRGTSFVPGFYEPVYTDTVGVSLGGMFSRRVEWGLNADAGKGATAISDNSGFNTVSASSKLSIAINRYLGMYTQYAAYGYEIPANSNALGLSDRLVRQSISVGLTAYMPLYKKMGQ